MGFCDLFQWLFITQIIPDLNKQIELEAYLNYTCFQFRFSTGQAHSDSIYPKHPNPYFKGNPKLIV